MKRGFFSKLLSFILIVTIIFPNFYNSMVAAGNEEIDTSKIELFILTGENEVKHTEDYQKEYWSGELIKTKAYIRTSGADLNIKNASIVITVPKLKDYDNDVISEPAFTKIDTATSWEIKQDEQNWYGIYRFKALSGGDFIAIPFDFKFETNCTPNGATVSPKFELFDGDENLLKSVSTTYTAKANGVENFFKISGKNNRVDAKTGEPVILVHEEGVREKTDEKLTSEEGVFATYTVGFNQSKVIGEGHLELGLYIPKFLKYVVHLPKNTVPTGYSLNNGWTFDEEKGIATIEFKAFRTGQYSIYNELSKSLEVRFKNLPMYKNNDDSREVPHEFVYTATAEYYVNVGTENEVKLEDKHINCAFEYKEIDLNEIVDREHDSFEIDAFGAQNGGAEGEGLYLNLTTFYNPIEKKIVSYSEYIEDAVYFISYVEHKSSLGVTGPGLDRAEEIKKIKIKMDPKLSFKFISFNHLEYSGMETDFKVPNKLYGVKKDGTREIIKENVDLNRGLHLDDPERKYDSIDLEFDDVLKLKKSRLSIQTDGSPIKEEKDKFISGEYKKEQRYNINIEVESRIEGQKEFKLKTETGEALKDNWSEIKFPNPKIRLSADQNRNKLYYREDNTVTEKVGAEFTGTWIGLEKSQNVKLITLLPFGIEFKEHKSIDLISEDLIKEKAKVVENFKNTGRTAVIYEFELAKDDSYDDPPEPYWPGEEPEPKSIKSGLARFSFDVDVKSHSNAGENLVEYFLVWENNDVILKDEDEYTYDYVDVLDLDDDGNVTEKFIRTGNTIEFIPPNELVSFKTISTEIGSNKKVAFQDIGQSIYNTLNIVNHNNRDMSEVVLYDVLPYIGDHKIVPNENGNYFPRNSEFETKLVQSLEDIAENENALKKFDIFYTLTPQGEDFESVKNAKWVTKDEIKDFSEVKSIKIVLKKGESLKVGEVVKFFTHTMIPNDKTLPNLSKAKSSFAISKDGINFLETNEVEVTLVKYKVKGKLFVDEDKDGSEDVKPSVENLSGYTVKLKKVDGSEEFVTTTKADGSYEFDVYKRGEYFVEFVKKDKGEVLTALEKEIENSGNSKTFKLSPEETNFDINVGIANIKKEKNVDTKPDVPKPDKPKEDKPIKKDDVIVNDFTQVEKGSIVLTKVDSENPQKTLEGVIFQLKDGVRIVKEAATDSNGVLKFEDVEVGKYTVVEKTPLEGYEDDLVEIEVELSKNGEVVNLGYIKNRLKKANIVEIIEEIEERGDNVKEKALPKTSIASTSMLNAILALAGITILSKRKKD